MFDDYIVFYNLYVNKLMELMQKEVSTIYSIFEKDVVCSVNVSLLDRIFNDQTLGVQFLLEMNNNCVTLSKEEKFEVFLVFHFYGSYWSRFMKAVSVCIIRLWTRLKHKRRI